ncbi:GTP-binding protein [Oligella ureolytica]
MTDDEYEILRKRLVNMNPRVSISPAHFGEADLNELLDMKGFNLTSALEIDPEFLKADDEHGHHHDHDCDEHCEHEHHHHHHDDEIGAFVFNSDQPFDPYKLDEFLSGLVQFYGPDMFRYKGILYIKGIKQRMLLQGVHMLLGTEPGKAWGKDKPYNKLVFIGKKLPKEIFLAGLKNCLTN